MGIKKGGVNKAEQAKWFAEAKAKWSQKKSFSEQLKGIHTETYPKKRASVQKDTVELSPEAQAITIKPPYDAGKISGVVAAGVQDAGLEGIKAKNEKALDDGKASSIWSQYNVDGKLTATGAVYKPGEVAEGSPRAGAADNPLYKGA